MEEMAMGVIWMTAKTHARGAVLVEVYSRDWMEVGQGLKIKMGENED
jgi:hypothetical protein